jgi:hypothetical protein
MKLDRGAVAVVDLAVPGHAGLFRLLCPDIRADTLGAAAGIVRDSLTGKPVRDAVVQVNWRSYDMVTSAFVSGKKLAMEVGSDSTGYFKACGVPVNTPLEALVITRPVTPLPAALEVLVYRAVAAMLDDGAVVEVRVEPSGVDISVVGGRVRDEHAVRRLRDVVDAADGRADLALDKETVRIWLPRTPT